MEADTSGTMVISVKQLRWPQKIKYLFLLNVLVIVVFLFVATWGLYSTHSYIYKSTQMTGSELGTTNTEQSLTAIGHKVTHIGFLKVHKAGSTTMQNMFFRFGLKHNLTFVLPKTRNYFLKTSSALSVAKGNHRDILACHSIYSRKLFQSVLPPDTVNIGIIREPLERMMSAAYYFRDVWHSHVLSKIPREYFIHNLILQPDRYDPTPFSKTRNAMGNDFGFPAWITEKHTEEINAHINVLRADFKLVMVMERFEESLVLLKRDLNWGLSDIIYIQSNSHKHKPVLLNKTELEMFRSTCFLDYAIYDTFYRIFDERVRREQSSLQPEVEYFKNILANVKTFCTNTKHINTPLYIQSSKWNEPFNVTFKDCEYMRMEEMKFLNRLKLRHASMNGLR